MRIALLFSVAAFFAAYDAAAQIMIDFDALEPAPQQQNAPVLKKPEKTQKKAAEKKPAPAKKTPAKKAAPSKKSPAAKPAAKQQAKSASGKTKTVAPAEKYQVVESEKQDEHDKLKPRSNPVPSVKIISLDVHEKEKPASEKAGIKEAETAKTVESAKTVSSPAPNVASAPPAAPEKPRAPQVAKPEKPALPVVSAPEKPVAAAPAEAVKPAQSAKAAEASESKIEPAATAAADAESAAPEPVKKVEKAQDVIVNAEKAVEKIVGQVMRKNAEKNEARSQEEARKGNPFLDAAALSGAKRSAALLRHIPEQAAGRKMLSDKTLLRDVILFEQNATALDVSSEKTFEALTDFLLKNPSKRIIVFTYAAQSEIEAGRERQLTLRRALYLRSRLAQAGVKIARIEIRSQGTKGAGESYPDRAEIYTYDR